MSGQFTGKHMAAILVGGFGIVFAVNFTMAALATSTFGGVVVENSYVASQKFNGWLEEAERVEKLGWDVKARHAEDGRVALDFVGVPDGVEVRGIARHPLGVEDDRELSFAATGPGQFASNEVLESGRWTVRLEVQGGGETWRGERALP